MKSSVVTLPLRFSAYHARIIGKNTASPIFTRSACSVIAPRL